MPKPLAVTLGLSLNPRTRALFDGTVKPNGVELQCASQFGEGLDNTGARHRAILQGKIDGGECSTSSLILARMRGVTLRALPVFLARQFRHRCMFCAADSNLAAPSELRGKRVTTHRYNSTTAVWVRGLLQNEYGVPPETMEWYVAEPDVGEEARRPPPGSVKFISPPRTREHAIELVETGAIDAALDPYSSLGKNPALRRLLVDYRREEANYFRRTEVIPVIHTLVLREKLASAQPWIIESLMSAFRQARGLAEKYMNEQDQAEVRWLSATIDYDPYAYSLDRSARKSLEALLHYQVQQGLLEHAPALEDLFFPDSMNL
ncbi:MAG: hypothetical protein ACREQW_16915 [Candidatus Binatia bacterium]